MRVQTADIRLSLSTRAAIGIARSVRPMLATAGSKRGRKNCCPPATSTWSSRCRGNFRHWRCRTNARFTPCYSGPAPRRCSRSAATRSSSERRSDSSASFTPGTSNSSIIRTFTVWFRPAVWLRTTRDGSTRSRSSSCRSMFSRKCSGASSWTGLKNLHAEHKLGFHGTLAALQNPKAFAAWLRPLFRSPWVVYCETPVWRRATRASLSRPVHPSGGDFKPSTRRTRRWHGHFSLARFRSQEQKTTDDSARWRVPPPIPAARAAAGIRPHPPLRVSGHRRRRASLPLCLQLLAESGRVPTETRSEERDWLLSTASLDLSAERGFIDDVIETHETRPKVIRALRMLETKVDTMPRKKHGNIPL